MATITNSGSSGKAAKGFGLMAALGLGMNTYFSLAKYDELRKQGKSVAYSTAGGVATFAAWNVIPGVMMGYSMLEVAPALIETGYIIGKENRDKVRGAYSRSFGGQYIDTQQNLNMRQAGIGTISQSKDTVSQALGQQAKSYYTHNLRQSREFSPVSDSKRYYTSQLGSEAKNFARNG